jgi:hypothetical protein
MEIIGKKVAPLPGSFMILSIAGFLITAFYIAPSNGTWGITFLILFATMFIAAFISMTKAPVSEKEVKRKGL